MSPSHHSVSFNHRTAEKKWPPQLACSWRRTDGFRYEMPACSYRTTRLHSMESLESSTYLFEMVTGLFFFDRKFGETDESFDIELLYLPSLAFSMIESSDWMIHCRVGRWLHRLRSTRCNRVMFSFGSSTNSSIRRQESASLSSNCLQRSLEFNRQPL